MKIVTRTRRTANGFMGYVIAQADGASRAWQESTGVRRITRADAMEDAKKFKATILEVNVNA